MGNINCTFHLQDDCNPRLLPYRCLLRTLANSLLLYDVYNKHSPSVFVSVISSFTITQVSSFFLAIEVTEFSPEGPVTRHTSWINTEPFISSTRWTSTKTIALFNAKLVSEAPHTSGLRIWFCSSRFQGWIGPCGLGYKSIFRYLGFRHASNSPDRPIIVNISLSLNLRISFQIYIS